MPAVSSALEASPFMCPPPWPRSSARYSRADPSRSRSLHVDLGHGRRAGIECGVDMSALRAFREYHLDGDWYLFDGHRIDFPKDEQSVSTEVPQKAAPPSSLRATNRDPSLVRSRESVCRAGQFRDGRHFRPIRAGGRFLEPTFAPRRSPPTGAQASAGIPGGIISTR
jgi:hypothetical protein